MNWLHEMSFLQFMEALSYLAISFGLPIGIAQYIRSKKKEERDREWGTYNALDDKYLEFQRLCLQHPSLDVWDVPDTSAANPSPLEEKRELILFTILVSLFERAFLMYSEQSKAIKRRQWIGWRSYMKDYARRENFRQAWVEIGGQFDEEFQRFMQDLIDHEAKN